MIDPYIDTNPIREVAKRGQALLSAELERFDTKIEQLRLEIHTLEMAKRVAVELYIESLRQAALEQS